jgi:hypothetical protein
VENHWSKNSEKELFKVFGYFKALKLKPAQRKWDQIHTQETEQNIIRQNNSKRQALRGVRGH